MSSCTNCCSDPCYPEPVDVTINQTIVQIESGEVSWDEATLVLVAGVATLPYLPLHPENVKVYVNGLAQTANVDFTISGQTITFLTEAPSSEDRVVANYMYASDGSVIGEVGTIAAWGGSQLVPPDGWLFCDGSDVSRTTYANLFEAIGVLYGSGDGATTFTLPTMESTFYDGVTYVTRKSIIKY